MTLTTDLKIFGARCRAWYELALPKGAKVKKLADILGQSDGTAERLCGEGVPTTAQLLAMKRHFGAGFIEYVFGDVDDADRELRVGRLLRGVRAEREKRCDARVLRETARAADPGAWRHAQPQPGQAGVAAGRLINERLPLESVGRWPSLREQLERFRERLGRIEPAEAVALARSDAQGRMGVVTRTIGDAYRFAYRPRAGTLVAPHLPIVGKPIAEVAPPDYAGLVEKTCAEAEFSAEPVLARLHGSVLRADGRLVSTDVVALRTAYRSDRRAASIVSSFVPVAA